MTPTSPKSSTSRISPKSTGSGRQWSAVRSKGSLYYALHAHGHSATGRWVGLSFDGPVVTGLATLARTEDEAVELMTELQKGERA